MNATAEQWRPIPGYEGRYDVSDLGRVRSWVPYHGLPAPRLLTPALDRDGYSYVMLGRKSRRQYIHRLVLAAYVGPRPEGFDSRHLDGDRTNNRPSNLAYGTRADNMSDAIRHGTIHSNAGRVLGPRKPRTHCRLGHAMTPENTYVPPSGVRVCRECMRNAGRRNDAKRRDRRNAERREHRRQGAHADTARSSITDTA